MFFGTEFMFLIRKQGVLVPSVSGLSAHLSISILRFLTHRPETAPPVAVCSSMLQDAQEAIFIRVTQKESLEAVSRNPSAVETAFAGARLVGGAAGG